MEYPQNTELYSRGFNGSQRRRRSAATNVSRKQHSLWARALNIQSVGEVHPLRGAWVCSVRRIGPIGRDDLVSLLARCALNPAPLGLGIKEASLSLPWSTSRRVDDVQRASRPLWGEGLDSQPQGRSSHSLFHTPCPGKIDLPFGLPLCLALFVNLLRVPGVGVQNRLSGDWD